MGTWLLQEAIKLAHWPINSLQISREMVAFLFNAREECHFSDARFLGLHPDKLVLQAYQLSHLTQRVSVLHAIASTHGGKAPPCTRPCTRPCMQSCHGTACVSTERSLTRPA